MHLTLRYLFVLQVLLYVFKVVVLGSLFVIHCGKMVSGFVAEGDLTAIFVEEDAAWYSLVPSIIERQ